MCCRWSDSSLRLSGCKKPLGCKFVRKSWRFCLKRETRMNNTSVVSERFFECRESRIECQLDTQCLRVSSVNFHLVSAVCIYEMISTEYLNFDVNLRILILFLFVLMIIPFHV